MQLVGAKCAFGRRGKECRYLDDKGLAHLSLYEIFWFRVAPDDAESVEPLADLHHLLCGRNEGGLRHEKADRVLSFKQMVSGSARCTLWIFSLKNKENATIRDGWKK